MKDLKRLWREQQVRMKLKAEGLDPLYEFYNTNDTTRFYLYGATWHTQTFTVGDTPHTITSVKLKLFRAGVPGTLTVGIRETDGAGKPTDGDLTSGTIDANDFTTDTAGVWYEIVLTEITLNADTLYAIVIRAPDGSSGNLVQWRMDVDGGYADGNWGESANSGSTWTMYTIDDAMFEVWGNPLAPPVKPKGTIAVHAKVAGII